MQPPRFSIVLRQAFEEALRHPDGFRPGLLMEPDLSGVEVRDLPRLARDPSVPLERQDRLLAGIVRCYRREQSGSWAAVLLEALAPGLVQAAAGLAPVARALTQDDIEQEVIAAALKAAAGMPMPDPPHLIKGRLTMRASWAAMRAVVAAARTQDEELGGNDAEEGGELDHQLAMFELADVRADMAVDEDLALALDVFGKGATFEEAGRELDLTRAAAESRCRRLILRLRSAA